MLELCTKSTLRGNSFDVWSLKQFYLRMQSNLRTNTPKLYTIYVILCNRNSTNNCFHLGGNGMEKRQRLYKLFLGIMTDNRNYRILDNLCSVLGVYGYSTTYLGMYLQVIIIRLQRVYSFSWEICYSNWMTILIYCIETMGETNLKKNMHES